MTQRRALPTLAALSLAACLFGPLPAAEAQGSVQFKVLADGTKVIYNESKVQRTRRTAGQLLPVPSDRLGHLINVWSRQRGLDPRLVQAVMQAESGYNIRARSSKGAMGLMQLMPATAGELGVTDPWDAEQNVMGGTLYLRRMLDLFGDTSLALAAYNAGPGAVTRYGGIPPYRETRHYVAKVLALWHGAPPPQYLQEMARDDAQRRAQVAAKERVTTPERVGEKVYVTRDANGSIVITSKRPN